MITLRIIDTNQNNYFPQKIEILSFKNIHYGGNSELNFKLNEDPSFQNHKINLFNNIYLYNFSQLIWSGYITEFLRDYKNLNYNLKASGLLVDFQNKRIKKTYVLDDIGDFKNWNEKDNKESDEILYGYSQAKEEKGVKISLLQRSYNAEEDGLFELKIDENIERLKARIFISQPTNFTTKLVTLDENHSNPTEEKKWENAKKIDEDVMLDITKAATGAGTFTKNIYINKDSYVFENEPNTNFGSSLILRVKYYSASHHRRSFLGCDVSEIPAGGEIVSAKLYIYCSALTQGSCGINLNRATAAWTEGGITWNNQSGVSDKIGERIIRSSGTTYDIDITTAFKNWYKGTWANNGFRIHALDWNKYMDFHSREAIHKPYIKVVYSGSFADIEVNKRYLQFRFECTGAENITTDKYFAQLENLKLLTSDSEINAANILKDLLFNHTQKLDLDASLIQDCFNYKNIELCESLSGWSVSDAVDLTLSLENTIVKEGLHSIKTVVAANSINEYLLKTLTNSINLQNKNLFRFWVHSTITGNILKARFGENLRYQYEPEWSCQYQANQKPQDAEPIWALTGTDYGSVSGGILTINKTGANECGYKRLDIGHNVKGNTIVARVKVDNAAKTTFLLISDGIAKTGLAIYTTKIEDWYDATNSYTIDMTKYRNLWLTMKNNFWVLYVDGILALIGETQISADKWFWFGMDGSANLGISYWDYIYYYNMSFLRNKRIEKTITIDVADTWEEKIIDLNNFPIATRDAIKYIQFEIATDDAFTFYIDWIRSNFELTSAYYRDRTAPLSILENALAYQDYEWNITKDRKVKFFEVDRDEIDYICPIKNLTLEENSVSYFSKIFLVYFDEMMKRQEIELIDEDSKIPFDKEHVIGLGGISDVGAKAIGEAQFSFHKKPRYQLSCSVEDFVFDKNGGRVNPIEIEPNNNVKFLGIATLPIFRIIKTDYSNGICRLTLETEEETLPNITKTIIGVL